LTAHQVGQSIGQAHVTAAGKRARRRCAWLSLLGSIVSFAVGAPASYANSGGAAVAWGGNLHAELGAGYRDTYEESPVPVVGLSNITAVAVGSEFTLALLSDGTVRAWGNNGHGQLGDGSASNTWAKGTDFVTVHGLSGVKAIAAANSHALALLENGTVDAWGNNNYGQLGDGRGGTEKATGESGSLPKAVAGLSNVIAIASGGGSNFALLSNHTLMAWGENHAGQLGIGETGPETCINELATEVACSTIPRPVMSADGVLEHVAAVSAGENAAYAVLENGRVMAWGANNMGQLGSGGELTHLNTTPEEVKTAHGEPLHGVTSVSGGAFDALALLQTGEVVGWGAVGKGELGSVGGPEECKAIPCLQLARGLRGLAGLQVTDLSAGEGYSLLVSGGKVYSFGLNEHGELGNETTTNSDVPTAIAGLGSVSEVAAGNANGNGKSHALALLQSGVPAPAPVVSVEPGAGSLRLLWSFPAEEFKLDYSHWNRKGLLGRITLGQHVHNFELTGLEATPYVILIKSYGRRHLEKLRAIQGTPLP
jgi:alpha-tubulin suppressor-like RCC1 family protein